MLTVIREMAEESERKEHRGVHAQRRCCRSCSRAARTRSLARPSCSTSCATPASSTPAAPASSRSRAGWSTARRARSSRRRRWRAEALGLDAIHQELSEYRYCTVFVVEGEAARQGRARRPARGDRRLASRRRRPDRAQGARAHGRSRTRPHARDCGRCRRGGRDREHAPPDRAARGAAARGRAGVRALATLETGLVAVCPGRGNRRLFESLGATRVIEGGQSMNPSAADIVEAIDAVPTDTVLVLPNNSNVDPHRRAGGGASARRTCA